ncbi:MAG: alpha-1,2-fucosyltransferase [Bacillota bacterium]
MRINKKLVKHSFREKSFVHKEPQKYHPNKKMMSCVFQQRFGNNLFQIAATVSHAEKHGYKYIFDNWRYSQYFDWDLYFSSREKNQYQWVIYQEPNFFYDPINQIYLQMCLKGWFQSYKYLDKNLIARKFKPKQEILNYIRNKYSYLFNNETTLTSIHVRRTDYFASDDHKVLEMEYYTPAINRINNNTTKFVVFSDDIEWCKNNFIGDKFVFIEGEEDYVDLFFMTLCHNNIIGNSTFSWWGAYLNNKSNKNVICPHASIWFNKNITGQDVCPKDWTTITY